ncbi:hypothetical protein BDY19DRAFT_969465 [Irpex rosettiformis]|uniref:Uncharacterized protein n=1 Tax=Irpex rosettiformis TaxID=378272 RepID=A0ACB8TS72_9APHY|nr:hypothetical protein BDY19DRAFT_969465 [Irpex rosettiformis]
MAIMDSNGDTDVMRVWNMLNEVSEQLAQNRNTSIGLHSLAAGVKTQAIHSQTGFVLRRFNLDKSQDEYNAELERMSAQMITENNTLQNDNKQLNALIKEYEQTLENVMSTFRTRANDVQQRELSIVREYERKILTLETEELTRALSQSTDLSLHLGRVCELLRSVMRVLGGEDPSIVPPPSDRPSSPNVLVSIRDRHIVNSLEINSSDDEELVVSERERQLAAAEYALERESELARLEQENAFLRQLAAEHFQLQQQSAEKPASIPELPKLSNLPKSVARTMKEKLGGKDIGPFGKWKKFGEDQ